MHAALPPPDDRRRAAPFRVLGGGGHRAGPGQDTPPHSHAGCWELVCYRTGRATAAVDGAAFAARPGVVWLTPPGPQHEERTAHGFSNWYLLLAAPAPLPWPTLLADDGQRSIERCCAAIAAELQAREHGREAMLDLLARRLALLLDRAAARGVAPPGLVAAAEALGEDDPVGTTPGGLARRLGVAPSTLRAAFQRERGTSPRAWLLAQRVQRAVDLLVTSDLPQAAIAAQCGFDSASHLHRCVRRLHGCAPGALRARLSARRR